jgi:drug/metabolite transporter (DMT)-like permease
VQERSTSAPGQTAGHAPPEIVNVPRPTGPSDRIVGAGLCALSAAGFATLSVLGKLAFATGLSLPAMLSLRFSGAALLLFVYLVLTRRALWPGRRTGLLLLGLGAVGYAGQSTLYFSGLARGSASISSLVLYVYPVFVALLGWAVEGRRPSGRQVLAMVVALAGVALTAGGAGRGKSSHDLLGPLFVLASAAWYAGYIILSHRVVHTSGSLVGTFWIACGAAFSFHGLALVGGVWQAGLPSAAVPILLAMAAFSTVLPLTTFLAGMMRVGPTTASLLSTLEPVFTVLLAAAVLGDRLLPPQWLGGALILAAVLLLQAGPHPQAQV